MSRITKIIIIVSAVILLVSAGVAVYVKFFMIIRDKDGMLNENTAQNIVETEIIEEDKQINIF